MIFLHGDTSSRFDFLLCHMMFQKLQKVAMLSFWEDDRTSQGICKFFPNIYTDKTMLRRIWPDRNVLIIDYTLHWWGHGICDIKTKSSSHKLNIQHRFHRCQIHIGWKLFSPSSAGGKKNNVLWVWWELRVSAPERPTGWGARGKGWGSRRSWCCCTWAGLARCWRRSRTRPRVWPSPGRRRAPPSERERSSWWWSCSALCTPGEQSDGARGAS